MKLDNRPKKLVVKGVREDALPTLRQWYEVRTIPQRSLPRIQVLFSLQTPGQLDSVDFVGDDEVLVGFRTRAAAEQVRTLLKHVSFLDTDELSRRSPKAVISHL